MTDLMGFLLPLIELLNAFFQFLTEEMDKLAEQIVMAGQNREAATRHPGLNAWFPDMVTRVIENIC